MDVMVTGAAPTLDEGKVKVLITYEDENGEVQEAEEKELSLFVTEDMGEDMSMDIEVGDFTDVPMEDTSLLAKYKIPIIAVAAVAAALGIFGVMTIRKKRKARQEEDEIDNEIS